MSNEFNTRKRDNYVCLDFPDRGVSLVYNSITKKYDFYGIDKPKTLSMILPTIKKSSVVTKVQLLLGGVLCIILAVHLSLLISKI